MSVTDGSDSDPIDQICNIFMKMRFFFSIVFSVVYINIIIYYFKTFLYPIIPCINLNGSQLTLKVTAHIKKSYCSCVLYVVL